MSLRKVYLSILVALALVCATEGKVCRSLAISGAGSFGAYEAGALKGLLEVHGGNPEWSKVSGISAGAIASAVLAQHDIGDEAPAVEALIDLWSNVKEEDLFRPFDGIFTEDRFKVLNGFAFQSGLMDTTPAHNLLRKFIDADKLKASTRDWTVAATNVVDLTLDFFDKNTSDPVTAVLASASIPGLFNATWYEGKGRAEDSNTWYGSILTKVELRSLCRWRCLRQSSCSPGGGGMHERNRRHSRER